jgi:hypothetical protein
VLIVVARQRAREPGGTFPRASGLGVGGQARTRHRRRRGGAIEDGRADQIHGVGLRGSTMLPRKIAASGRSIAFQRVMRD